MRRSRRRGDPRAGSMEADMHAAMRGAGIVSTSAADALTRAVEEGSRVRWQG